MALSVSVAPLADRCLAESGMEALRFVAEREASPGGVARTENLRRRIGSQTTWTVLKLENAGFINVKMGINSQGTMRMTDAGWTVLGGKPEWL